MRTVYRFRFLISLVSLVVLISCTATSVDRPPFAADRQEIDLTPLWDEERVLENPHKGWYHHYYDNGIVNYPPYVDVGSYGDWGEGHNSFSGRGQWSFDVLKRHIDIHLEHYRGNLIVVSEDMVTEGVLEEDRQPLAHYIESNDLTYRDDSILVEWYVQQYPSTFSVRSPEMFERIWRDRPVILEMHHYRDLGLHEWNLWVGPDGSVRGASTLKNAVELTHATWLGYHGWAAEFYQDNPNLAGQLANRLGYWFFPEQAVLPERARAGTEVALEVTWANRGVAPAYHPYELIIRLVGREQVHESVVPEANPRTWMPDTAITESYILRLPRSLGIGEYDVELGLRHGDEVIALGLREDLERSDGLYLIGQIDVVG